MFTTPEHRTNGPDYCDPVDEIWLQTASRLGMTVARSDEVFASWDGEQTLTISTPDGFDPDDCLAQMIFHEICHALVEGPASHRLPDWGLENIDDRHLLREYSCHRLQAALSDLYGLRAVLAPTTVHRAYYERLPPNPMAPCDDPALPAARAGWRRATAGPWAAPLREALEATADIAAVLRRFRPDSLWARARPRHPTGLPPGDTGASCGDCAWRHQRCLRADAPVSAETPACRYFTPRLSAADCASCGACCRQGFDVVDVEADNPVLQTHPEWIVDHGWGPQLPRPGGFCVALQTAAAPYRCRIYEHRPGGCRGLEIGGEACLTARRRVGLSP